MVPAYTDEEMYKYGEACIATHPPEADKLLQQALEYAELMQFFDPAFACGNTTTSMRESSGRSFPRVNSRAA